MHATVSPEATSLAQHPVDRTGPRPAEGRPEGSGTPNHQPGRNRRFYPLSLRALPSRKAAPLCRVPRLHPVGTASTGRSCARPGHGRRWSRVVRSGPARVGPARRRSACSPPSPWSATWSATSGCDTWRRRRRLPHRRRQRLLRPASAALGRPHDLRQRSAWARPRRENVAQSPFKGSRSSWWAVAAARVRARRPGHRHRGRRRPRGPRPQPWQGVVPAGGADWQTSTSIPRGRGGRSRPGRCPTRCPRSGACGRRPCRRRRAARRVSGT